MCTFYHDEWCNRCGQIIITPEASNTPTTVGIARRQTDKACGQYIPNRPISKWKWVGLKEDEK
jgi:hypothetical protein